MCTGVKSFRTPTQQYKCCHSVQALQSLRVISQSGNEGGRVCIFPPFCIFSASARNALPRLRHHGELSMRTSFHVAEMDDFPGLLLTNDLWAHIFSLVAKEVFDKLRTAYLRRPKQLLPRKEYSQLHCIRLVCRNFNNVFKEHPELSAL